MSTQKNKIHNPLLDDAANAVISGDRSELRYCLDSISDKTKEVSEAWLLSAWASDTCSDAEESLNKVLELDPGNGTALAGLDWVNRIQAFANQHLESKERSETEQRLEMERLEEEARKAEQEAREAEEEDRLAAELQLAEEKRIEAEWLAEEARQAEEDQLQTEEAEEVQLDAENDEPDSDSTSDSFRSDSDEEDSLVQMRAQAVRQEALAATGNAASSTMEIDKQIALAQARFLAEEEAGNYGFDDQQDSGDSVGTEEPVLATPVGETVEDSLELESEIQEASESLALEVHEAAATETTDSDDGTETQSENRKPIVLSVDDSATIRKIIALTLGKEGIEVISAKDGLEAITLLTEQRPDLILSDISMPNMGGYKLCSIIKKKERTKDIPVVMLSGKDGMFDKMRGRLNGCDDFLTKPFETTALLEMVQKYIKVGATD